MSEEQAFEAPVRQASGRGFPWLMTCGIGCGLLFLLLAILIGGFGVMGFVAMKQVKSEIVATLPDELAAMKAQQTLPEDKQQVFDELVAFCQRPDSSMPAAIAVALVIDAAKTATEAELQQVLEAALALHGVLRDKPDAGMMDLLPLLERFPEMEKRFEQQVHDAQDGVAQEV